MIKTVAFGFTPLEYFKIVATNRFRRSWWFYLLCLIVGSLSLDGFVEDKFSTFLVIFCFSYPFIIFIYLYFWTNSKKNVALFVRRQLEFNDEKIAATLEDGSKNEIALKYVFKIIERDNYWLLYISKGQFVYVPKSAFETIEEMQAFEQLLNKLPVDEN